MNNILEEVKTQHALGAKVTMNRQTRRAVMNNKTKKLLKESFPFQPSVSNQKLECTLENLQHLIDSYGIEVYYDEIAKDVRIECASIEGSADNLQNASLAVVKSLAKENGMLTNDIKEFLSAIANANRRNPAKDWIESRSWDGIDRLPEFHATLVTTEGYPEGFKETLMTKWGVSAIAALYAKPFHGRGVLTLQGAQRVGKTTWFRNLVCKELTSRLVKLDHYINAYEKDTILGAIDHWYVELGELDSSLGREHTRLKGILTRPQDKIRRPYAHNASEYDRRTVFGASVNEFNFLADSTGNSRFWTIPVVRIDNERCIDMQQLHAQLKVLFDEGMTWWLNDKEEAILESINRKHQPISVIRDAIEKGVDIECANVEGCMAFTPTELLKKLGWQTVSNPQAKECGGILREMFGDPKKIKDLMRWRLRLRSESGDDTWGAPSFEVKF